MPEKPDFDAVVIGSGFGGTIAALTLANYFLAKGGTQRVCLLERGQWWISHELPYRAEQPRIPTQPNMREFLQDTKKPFDFWAHPDNVKGLVDLASKTRFVNKAGLYDVRPVADNVAVIAASGVGGGSLIYSNVTLEPPESVYNPINQNKSWPTERDGGEGLKKYFEPARIFMGVNKITTIAGLGPKNSKLEKSRVFQEAAHRIRMGEKKGKIILNDFDPNNPDPDLGFAVPLSITDVPVDAFKNLSVPMNGTIGHASQDRLVREAMAAEVLIQQNQQNVCQRQGRCNLGCLPGARHTLNKKIVNWLQKSVNKDVLTVQALHEADWIEFDDETKVYTVHCRKYDKEGELIGEDSIRTGLLVVAAGTLGTNELLLRSRDRGLKLSSKLGEGFSPNGDLLGFTELKERQVDITRGPINSCHALFSAEPGKEFKFSIEDTAISKMVAGFFATLFELVIANEDPTKKRARPGSRARLRKSLSLIQRFGLLGIGVVLFGFNLPRAQKMFTKFFLKNKRVLENLFTKKISSSSPAANVIEDIIEWSTNDHENPHASPEERLKKFFVFSCMGLDNADGKLELPKNQLKLKWSFEKNRQVFESIRYGMKQLAEAIEPGAKVYTPTWIGKSLSLVVLHPLGGCVSAADAGHGVVNSHGQVFRTNSNEGTSVYPNFYVMDGSIVPSALGVNSSLTIAALAFRCVEHMIEQLDKSVKGRDYWPGVFADNTLLPNEPPLITEVMTVDPDQRRF